MKKKIFLTIAIVCVAAVLVIFWNHIGAISGAEWEYLTIEDCKYERVGNAPVSGSDKGYLIGIAANGDKRCYIYSIKGCDNYLYCKWEWEGWIYQRIQ